MKAPTLTALCAALAVLCTAANAAPDVSLEVTHQTESMGADGVKRTTEFKEKVFRRGDTVWVERVMPPGTHSDADHAKAKQVGAHDHKHVDLAAASRWIERGADKKIRFRLVSSHDKVVVDIAPAEFATVGFDGSWPAAYHLIDPAILGKLSAGSVSGSRRWYLSPEGRNVNQVRVLWESQLQVPLQVLTQSADGLSKRTTQVRVLNDQTQKPWQMASKFAVKDYSDFLD